MERSAIVAEIKKWQNQYNAYQRKINQNEKDIEKLEHIRDKVKQQLNIFMGYLQKRKNKLNKFKYLTDSSRIAGRFIVGMQGNIDGPDSRRIINNLNSSISDVSGQIRRMETEIEQFRANMSKCAQNYNYWIKQLNAYDAAAAAGGKG